MEKGIKILFIGNDPVVNQALCRYLKASSYDVYYLMSTNFTSSILYAFRSNIILVDIDIENYPYKRLIPDIRNAMRHIPIVLLANPAQSKRIIAGCQQGISGYLPKELDPESLVACLERFFLAPFTRTIQIGHYTLDVNTHILYFQGEVKERLSKKLFCLLSLLYQNLGSQVSHQDISEAFSSKDMNEHSLYNMVSYLRKLLAKDPNILIRTSHKSYMLVVCG